MTLQLIKEEDKLAALENEITLLNQMFQDLHESIVEQEDDIAKIEDIIGESLLETEDAAIQIEEIVQEIEADSVKVSKIRVVLLAAGGGLVVGGPVGAVFGAKVAIIGLLGGGVIGGLAGTRWRS